MHIDDFMITDNDADRIKTSPGQASNRNPFDSITVLLTSGSVRGTVFATIVEYI